MIQVFCSISLLCASLRLLSKAVDSEEEERAIFLGKPTVGVAAQAHCGSNFNPRPSLSLTVTVSDRDGAAADPVAPAVLPAPVPDQAVAPPARDALSFSGSRRTLQPYYDLI